MAIDRSRCTPMYADGLRTLMGLMDFDGLRAYQAAGNVDFFERAPRGACGSSRACVALCRSLPAIDRALGHWTTGPLKHWGIAGLAGNDRDERDIMTKLLTRYEASVTVTACGRDWTLVRAGDLDRLWEEMVADGKADADEHIPYWTELWPSALVLCDWLERQKDAICGRTCLDMGCGLGLTALVGSHLGARVVAMDLEEEALRHAKENARLNGVASPLWVAMDWSWPAMAEKSVSFVWGGDIMYERRFVEPVLDFCACVLETGGKFWVAEPGRSVYDAFLEACPARGWRSTRVFEQECGGIYAQSAAPMIAIWELERVQ